MRIVITLFVVMMLLGCGYSKSTAAAATSQDVINAWNTCRGTDWIEITDKTDTTSVTMYGAFIGVAATQTALDNFMAAIAAEIDCSFPTEPGWDDPLSDVINAPEWYQ